MRISDWSSDVCSSDLEMGRTWYDDGKLLHKKNTFTDFIDVTDFLVARGYAAKDRVAAYGGSAGGLLMGAIANMAPDKYRRSEEHTSELQSLMRISYAVFCLKKKKTTTHGETLKTQITKTHI